MSTYEIIVLNMNLMLTYGTILLAINLYVNIWVYNAQYSFLSRNIKMWSILSYFNTWLDNTQYGFISQLLVRIAQYGFICLLMIHIAQYGFIDDLWFALRSMIPYVDIYSYFAI